MRVLGNEEIPSDCVLALCVACIVRYGLSSTRYDLTNCTFTVAHSQLECVTVPGVGIGHRLQVCV